MRTLVLVAALAAINLSVVPAHEVRAAETRLEADEVANEQMVAFHDQGLIGRSVWVVDSRPAGKYAAGHIPGALSLPLDVLAKDNAAADRLGIPRTGKVIFYCAGRECTLSPDSAAIFRKLGYADTWVYRNGIPGWNQKAQPLRAEESFLRKGNLIMIDTAVGQDTIVAAGSRTLQIAAADLATASGLKLLEGLSRNAPIVVLERGDMAAVNDALEALRDQDFRRMAYFPINAWKEALAKAPAPTALSWAPVYAPGQVSPKAFEEAVASGRFILDVRPAADFARGHFKGAVNLPIEDLERDYARIPRDVPVFVNCATGAKSIKSHDILARKGYGNVSYLDAEIACKGETCTIKE